MEDAFERLTPIQKENINRKLFEFAYKCVAEAREDPEVLESIVERETEGHPHLRSDLIRYCRLVESVR